MLPNRTETSGESTGWPAFVAGVVAGMAGIAAWGAPGIAVQTAAATGLIGVIAARIAGTLGSARRPSAFVAGAGASVLVASGVFADAERTSRLERSIGEGRVRGVVRGTVVSGPEPLREGWGFEVRVASIDGGRMAVDGERVRFFLEGRPLEGRPAVEAPVVGDRVEMFARLERYPRRAFPGVPSGRWRMRTRGIAARGVVLDEGLRRLGQRSGPIRAVRRWLSRMRLDYTRSVTRHLEPEPASYVLAMSAGARGLLTDRQYAPFLRTGTAHLLAISGLHLGILAWMLWRALVWLAGWWPGLLRRFGRRRVCAIPLIVVLAGYVAMIGAPVSAVRAFLMVAAVAAARCVIRPVDSLHALGAALVAVLFWAPGQIASLGCHLSFGATFAILWFLRRLPAVLQPAVDGDRRRCGLRRWCRKAGIAAGVSVSATLATWPILLAWNGAVPVDGLWTNLVVTPLASLLLVPAIFGGAALFTVFPALGGPVLSLAGAAVSQLSTGLAWVAARPPFDIVTGQLAVPTAAALALGAVTVAGSRLRWRPLAVGTLLIAAALGIGAHRHGAPEDQMRLHFIPVGQGDATLARLPDGRTLLVDAGGRRLGSDPGRRTVVPYLHRLGIGRLDWVVATHADFDHVGGLVAVARRMRPETFVYHPVDGARRLNRVVGEMGAVGTRRVVARDERRLAEAPVEIRVQKPGVGAAAEGNDISLVTRISYGGRSALLPGDIEAAGEQWFVEQCRAGRGCGVDVLKVPHHGSNTSSTAAFLRRTRPGAAVVSAGKFNAFGHPAEEVVARYAERQIPLWETARHGLVRAIFREDGRVEIRAMRPDASGAGDGEK